MNKFIVVNASTGPSRHPYVHTSLAQAQEEAGRISVQSPGSKVYVLQVVGYMQHNKGIQRTSCRPKFVRANRSVHVSRGGV